MFKNIFSVSRVFALVLLLTVGSVATCVATEKKTPELIITLIVADSENVTDNTGKLVDGYELIEIYNSSGKALPLAGYKVDILGNNGSCPLGDRTLPAGGFLYLWGGKNDAMPQTVEEYVKYWGNTFKTNDVIEASACRLVNTAERMVTIVGPGEKAVSSAIYNNNKDNKELSGKDKGAVYGIHPNGGVMLTKLGIEQPAIPGVIRDGQIPKMVSIETGSSVEPPKELQPQANVNVMIWVSVILVFIVTAIFIVIRRKLKAKS